MAIVFGVIFLKKYLTDVAVNGTLASYSIGYSFVLTIVSTVLIWVAIPIIYFKPLNALKQLYAPLNEV